MTGLGERKLEELVEMIHDVLAEQQKLPSGKGRPPVLDLAGQVIVTLVLLRRNATEQELGEWVGLSQQRVSDIKTSTEALIAQALEGIGLSLEELTAGRTLVVDGTYVPTGNRKATGKGNYSGKRHRQCVNIQVACNLSGRLLAVSAPVAGARHDAAALKLCGWADTLAQANWVADSAYSAAGAITPVKRLPRCQLADSQKLFNHDISHIRAVVERCNAHLKNWKILATGYRRKLKNLPAVITLVTKLELYRLA